MELGPTISSTELKSKHKKHHPFQSEDQALAPSSSHIPQKFIPSVEVDKDDVSLTNIELANYLRSQQLFQCFISQDMKNKHEMCTLL